MVQRRGSPKERLEWLKCSRSFVYWLHEYGYVYDAVAREWVRFRLWEAQRDLAGAFPDELLWVVLKARQLGMTWLVLGFLLWLMLFRPAATVLLFSKRDNEAVELLDTRLKGMYERLPAWQQCQQIEADSGHAFQLSNGSVAKAFPTTGGRSYTATAVFVDEADFVGDLRKLLDAVKPTVDAGGWLFLVSTVDKSQPGSSFKAIYRAAVGGENGYRPVFLPWWAHPERGEAWYAQLRADYLARDGHLDSLYQEYPATDSEALAGASADKRFPAQWLAACDATAEAKALDEGPAVPGLTVYARPEAGWMYVVSADPAEGNPQSDESAAQVLAVGTGDQVAVLGGRFEPGVFAGHLLGLSEYYGAAPILVERNNHGHAVLLALEYAGYGNLYVSPMDKKAGWLSNKRDKVLAVDHAVQVMREGGCRINHEGTLTELATLEARTLKAPEGGHDDLAMAFINGLAGLWWKSWEEARGEGVSVMLKYPDIIDELKM